MGDVVKYAAASAMPNHKQFLRQGFATRASGSKGKKSLIDGYIAITTVDGQNSITTVLDLPAHILWLGRNSFDGFATWYFGAAVAVGTRDLYVPNSAPSLLPLSVTDENAKRTTPDVYQFVAPDYDLVTDGTGKAYVHGLPDVHHGWIYGITHARVNIDADPTLEEFVMIVYGVRWNVAMQPLGANNALVIPPPGIDPLDLLPSTRSRVLCVPALSVAAEAGKPGIIVAQTPNNAFIASVQVRETTVVDAPPLVRVYTAVAGRDTLGATTADEPVVLVSRVTLSDVVEQALDWGVAPSVAAGYAGAGVLNVTESIGLYVGSEVTVCTVAHDAPTSYYQTMLHRLHVDTGAVLGASTFTLYPEISAPICSTRDALWVAKATTAGDVSTSCTLYRVVDGAATLIGTGGWMPVCLFITGIDAGDNIWEFGAMAPAVVELGEDRVGVIACAAGSYSPGTAISWYLIEVEVSTQSFVGVRGLIGTASVTSLRSNIPRPLSISVVTPQVLDDDGDVTTPAVLLKSVLTTTSVSTDGGYTWHDIATGAYGYPYYFGNRAHAFTPSETL